MTRGHPSCVPKRRRPTRRRSSRSWSSRAAPKVRSGGRGRCVGRSSAGTELANWLSQYSSAFTCAPLRSSCCWRAAYSLKRAASPSAGPMPLRAALYSAPSSRRSTAMDHPSQTMWCAVNSRRCSASCNRTIRARTSGPCTRSKGVVTSWRTSSDSASRRRSSSMADRSTRGMAMVREGAIRSVAPSGLKVPRNASCRCTTPSIPARNAAASSAPVSLSDIDWLKAQDAPSPICTELQISLCCSVAGTAPAPAPVGVANGSKSTGTPEVMGWPLAGTFRAVRGPVRTRPIGRPDRAPASRWRPEADPPQLGSARR